MSNPEPDRIKEAAITISERFVIEPEWPVTQVEETTDAIEKVIREAVAQKDLDAENPVLSLSDLWQKHQKGNLTDQELETLIQRLQDVNEFIENVRTDRLFYIMNINMLKSIEAAREEHRKNNGKR